MNLFRSHLARWQAINTVLVAFIVSLLLSSIQIAYDFFQSQSSLKQNITQVVDMMKEPASQAIYEVNPQGANFVINGLLSYQPINRVEIIEEEGRLFAEETKEKKMNNLSHFLKFFFKKDQIFNFDLKYPGFERPIGYIIVHVDTYYLFFDFIKRSWIIIINDVARNILLSLILTSIFYFSLIKHLLSMETQLSNIDPAYPSHNLLKIPAQHQKNELGLIIKTTNLVLRKLDDSLVRHRKAETELTLHRDQLNELVAERTIELEKAKETAEDASKFKSEFLANMSHEIRTPLNGIIGMTELAMDTKLDNNQQNIMNTIDSEATSLLRLINDILDFSKIEAGMLELENISFDLRSLVEDVGNSIAMRITNEALEVVQFVDPKIPPKIIGDPGRLRQILINIMGNALKFTQKGEIQLNITIIEQLEAQIKTRLTISDTGIGISEKNLAIIFNSFTQADGSTTRKFGGTGLGTTIAKQLTELMSGQIGAESNEGCGSTFWLEIPFIMEKDLKVSTAQSIFSGKTILVIDENVHVQKAIDAYLSFNGAMTLSASSIKDAQKHLEAHCQSGGICDLVLVNNRTVHRNENEFNQVILNSQNTNSTPIVFLSIFRDMQKNKYPTQFKPHFTVIKPVKHAALIETLAQALQLEDIISVGMITDDSVITETYAPANQGISILLAEDYPTNQQVAIRHLNRAGYSVDLAENGQEAIDKFIENAYHLILMDMQMPIIDGFKAIKIIRDIEQKNCQPDETERIPIISLTALAIQGDRERCLQTGADDYLTKPLKRKDLLNIIHKWTQKENIPDCVLKETHIVYNTDAPLDYQVALSEYENDKAFLIEVIEGFIEKLNSQIRTIKKAIQENEYDIVHQESHAIKGGASNLRANPLSEAAALLEQCAKNKNFDGAMEIYNKILFEKEKLMEYIKDNIL